MTTRRPVMSTKGAVSAQKALRWRGPSRKSWGRKRTRLDSGYSLKVGKSLQNLIVTIPVWLAGEMAFRRHSQKVRVGKYFFGREDNDMSQTLSGAKNRRQWCSLQAFFLCVLPETHFTQNGWNSFHRRQNSFHRWQNSFHRWQNSFHRWQYSCFETKKSHLFISFA